MSDIVYPSLDDPEQQLAMLRAQAEYAKKFANSVVSMPLSLMAPDPRLTDITGGPRALNYIPFTGLAEAIPGMVAGVSDALGTVRNYAMGKPPEYSLNIPGMATARTLGEHQEATRAEMQGDIGRYTPLTAPDPTNEADRLVDIAGSTLGFGLPIASAGAVRAATGLLPRAVQGIGHAVPSTASVPRQLAAMGTFGGVEAGLQGAADATEGSPAIPQPTQMVPLNFNDYLAQQQQPQQQQQQQQQQQEPAPYDINAGLNAALRGENTVPAPAFQDQGVGEFHIWHALAAIGGVMIAIGAGRALHGIGAEVTEAGRTARIQDPVYAAKAQDYNNAKIARGGAEISPDNPVKAPPLPEPNYIHQATNYANTKVLDRTAQMQDAIRMTGDPTTAEALAHEFGDAHNDMSQNTKSQNFMATGYDPQSGVQMGAVPERVFRRINALNPAEQRVMMDGLSAYDEMDNRVDKLNKFNNANPPGTKPTPDDIRHNFKGQDNDQLQVIIDRMMKTDPKLATLAGDFWKLPEGVIDIGEARGYYTKTEAADLRATHPHYVPEVGPTGETLHVFGPRDKTLATGVDQVNSMPWHNMAQHLEELRHEFDKNDLNVKLDRSFRDAQIKNPGAAQFIYDATAPAQTTGVYTGGQFREPIVTLRTPSGPKYSRVDHPDILNAMTGDSLKRQHILADAITVPRRIFQKGTTGSLSLATGYMAPVVNATYTSALMATNAPKGMYGGLVHRAVTRATGGRWDSGLARGIDMATNLPGVAYSYGRGVVDRRVNNIANVLEKNAPNPVNRWLRANIGDVQVDKMQQAMQDYYRNTITNIKGQMGVSGLGIPIKTDLPSLQIASDKRASLVSARAVPDLFYADSFKIPMTNVAIKPFFIKLNRVVEDAMANMSEAGHDYFMRLNWDNPNINRTQLAYETRRLTGDPGVQGSSTGLGVVSGVLPYFNISLQGTARLGRSLGERPINSMLTLATGLGTLALVEILTHMRSKEHMDYFQNQLSSQQSEANVVLATNPDPTRGTLVKLPQELRMAHAFMKQFVANGINTVAMQHDASTFTGVLNAIKDFLGSNVSTATEDAMVYGAVDVLNAINLPPIAGQFDQNKLFHGSGLSDAYRLPYTPTGTPPPNQVPDGPLDDKNGQIMTKLFSNIFGTAGMMLGHVNDAWRYATQTGSWAEGLGMAGHDWLQGIQDKNPQANVIWEQQLRSYLQPPIVERTERELDWMKKVTGARTEALAAGFTSRDRSALPVPTTQGHKIPTDPTMASMYSAIQTYYGRMKPQVDEISDIRKQMGAIQQQGLDVVEKRKWMNDQTRVLADKYRFLHDMVNDTSYALGQIAGVPVHVGQNIDWSKGPEQFR